MSHPSKENLVQKLICPLCKETFNQRSFLSIHILRTHFSNFHEPGKKHKCTLCKQEFKLMSSLLTHMLSVHEGMKHKCVLCEETKTYSSNDAFMHHMNTIHKEKRPENSILNIL